MAVTLDQVKETKKTEVGSYFISNYPPFSVWSGQNLTEIQEAFDTPPKNPEARLGLLLKAGFEREGRAPAYLKINGAWRDHVLFGRLTPYRGHEGPDEGVSV